MLSKLWERIAASRERLFANDQTEKLGKRLIRGAAGTFGLRIGYTGLTFIISVFLARLLGTSGFGTYAYAVTWAYLLGIPATLGLDNLIVREAAVYQTQSAWSLLRGLLRWAHQIVSLLAVVLALVAMGTVWIWGANVDAQLVWAFCLAMISVPVVALRNVRQGAMRGLHRIVLGFVPEMLLAPLLLMVLTVSAYLLLRENLTAPWVAGMYVVAATITFVISGRMLKQLLPPQMQTVAPQYQASKWFRSALPFVFLVSMFFVNDRIDVLMLGAIRGAEAVGVYVPVNRGAQLMVSILMAVRTAMEPTIASFYAQGKMSELQKVVTQSARAVLCVSFPVAISLIVFGYWYLLLFGVEFTQGTTALTILCVGQLLNTATGSPGALLNMTGYERHMAIMGGTSAVVNIILNALMIPRWGVEGAATATAISLVSLNVCNVIWVRLKLGIDATAMGLGKKV